jgi:hypothetical protein
MRHCCILTALLLVLGWTGARAATIEVPADYPTIQRAISASSNGDTVLVSPGTYVGSENRNLDFGGRLISVVSVGGAGSTLIDCMSEGRGFYLHSWETRDAVIEGFTIANGYASHGGGIRCENSAGVTIRGCVIRDSEAYYGGGGVSCSSAGSVYLEDVTLSGNEATYGGGLIASSSGALELKGCTFKENTATFTGGLRCEASPAALSHVTFEGNVGTSTVGGMSCFDSEYYDLSYCVFRGNSSPICGGFGGARATARLTNCTFVGNDADQGGAVNCGPTSDFQLHQCILAYQDGGGAIYCEVGGAPTITHTCVYGNTGGDALCGDYWDNLSVDPMFCDLAQGDLTLDTRSACLPGGNVWAQLIGAFADGCGPSSVTRATWTTVKAMFK